jgi:hypothetical protein
VLRSDPKSGTAWNSTRLFTNASQVDLTKYANLASS